MPRVGIEPMSPMFEREETIHDLDRAATTVGPTMIVRRCNFFL
jgi:hypothetical protein